MKHEEAKRVVRVNTNPETQRSEYVQTETNYVPVATEDKGITSASVALIAISIASVSALLFVILMYNNQRQEDENLNNGQVVQQQQPQPVIVQQPAQQPPVVVQQPPAQPPIVVQQPSTSSPTSPSSFEKDMSIQSEIDKKLADDGTFSRYSITASVMDGKVTLIGAVNTADIKQRIEKMVRAVKGVKEVDNKIIVSDLKSGHILFFCVFAAFAARCRLRRAVRFF